MTNQTLLDPDSRDGDGLVFEGEWCALQPLDRRAFRAALEFEEHRRLLDHWLDIRGAGGLPGRKDLDPAAFHTTLRHAGLIDVVGPEPRFRYRLVGTELERRFHRPLTGRFLEEVKSADYADYLRGLYLACVTGQSPLFVAERSTLLADYPLCCYRLLLPMAGDRRVVDAILYSTISDADLHLSLAKPTRRDRGNEAFRAYALVGT